MRSQDIHNNWCNHYEHNRNVLLAKRTVHIFTVVINQSISRTHFDFCLHVQGGKIPINLKHHIR